MQKTFFTMSSSTRFREEVMMGIETVITAGDRRQSPFFPMPPHEKPSAQGAATGSFEEVLRLALARSK